MVWIGHIESARAPVPDMRFALEQKRPNKTRLEIHASGQGSMRVFDGVHGWKARPARGRPEVLPYTPQELKFAQAGHGIDGPLIDYAAKGNSVTLESLDKIAGRQAYHLKLHLADGGSEEIWVDAETFLEVRYDRLADDPGGTPRRVSVSYGDYRTVDGLKIPFDIETGGGGVIPPDKMLLETVALNAPLDDSTFGNPAIPRPRSALRSGATPSLPASAAAEATAASGKPGFTPQ
jgi:hypothetical protein